MAPSLLRNKMPVISITNLFAYYNVVSLLCMMAWHNDVAYSFTPIRRHNRHYSHGHILPPENKNTIRRASAGTVSSSSLSGVGEDTFILSYDGVIANTAESKARLAIDAAVKTWPHLFDGYENNENQEEDDDRYDWLINKMMALSHVCVNSDDSSNNTNDNQDNGLSCDSVLLVRMLWEEQLLDNDASVTCNGKYASRFHPSTSMNASSNKGNDGNRRRSRPLTVGEISINWSTGALLRDTTRVKYNIDRKDPIPIIQQNLRSILHEKSYNHNDVVKTNTMICDAIATAEQTSVYILAQHPSQIPSIIESIQSATSITPPNIKVITHNDLFEKENIINENENNCLFVVSPQHNQDQTTPQSDIINQLLSSLKDDNAGKMQRFHVIHSTLSVLNDAKYLFGDDSPRFMDGCSSTVMGENVKLSLRLPLWADNISLQQRNDAEMDAWLSVIAEDKLTEMISTPIITKQ